MMYTLMITIVLQWQNVTATQYAIPNFTSLERCTTAGTQWLGRQTKGLSKMAGSYDISALCVKQ